MSKVFINKKKASEIIKLYKNSTKIKKISEKVNLSIYVITNFLKKKKIFDYFRSGKILQNYKYLN